MPLLFKWQNYDSDEMERQRLARERIFQSRMIRRKQGSGNSNDASADRSNTNRNK